MAGFIATGGARKTFEKMYFDKLDNKKGKGPKNKGGDSIWDQMAQQNPEQQPKKQ